MRFAFAIALRTVVRKPFRTAATAFLIALMTFAVFAGGFLTVSLKNGLDAYKARLGADVIVVPSSAAGHGSVDDIFLQGITGNYYLNARDVGKVTGTDGIAAASTQFFLTSAKASCCSTRVQIIGFDPETDFTVLPWIAEKADGSLSDGEVVAGADINVPASGCVTFYGEDYPVKAKLEKTGTGLDSAVYANMATVKRMAKNAARLLETGAFDGVDIDSAASAVFIRASAGVDPQSIADDINVHVTKANAKAARSMIASLAAGLSGVSGIIGALIAALWLLAAAILFAAFSLLAGERKREFAVLRVCGASGKAVFGVMTAEVLTVCVIGAVIGLFAALAAILPLAGLLRRTLALPMSVPGAGTLIALAVGALMAGLAAGLAAATTSAYRLTRGEAGLSLREEA